MSSIWLLLAAGLSVHVLCGVNETFSKTLLLGKSSSLIISRGGKSHKSTHTPTTSPVTDRLAFFLYSGITFAVSRRVRLQFHLS
jgi:hypothetical protein